MIAELLERSNLVGRTPLATAASRIPPGLLQDGDVGVCVFPEGEKSSAGFRYCGSPTFRAISAKRGSERMGSSKKSVLKPSRYRSRS